MAKCKPLLHKKKTDATFGDFFVPSQARLGTLPASTNVDYTSNDVLRTYVIDSSVKFYLFTELTDSVLPVQTKKNNKPNSRSWPFW